MGSCLSPSLAKAVTTIDEGPVSLTFYQNAETDGSSFTGSQDWTSQQMQDVVASVRTWTSAIANVTSRQVQIHCFWNNFSGGILGSSYNSYVGDGTTAWTLSELVWREHYNYSYGYSDATLVYDTDAAGYSWNFGEATPPALTLDFRSVVTHEVGHSLGFMGTYNSTTDTWWSGGITAWDSMLRDDAGNAPAPGTSGNPGNFNQLDNPVWFTGANAMAANGGNPVAVYAPGTYSAGSSLLHLDYATYTDTLMSPFMILGNMERTPSAVEWGVMQDIGWTLVPEPGVAWLTGLGWLAFCSVRRRR